MTAIRGGAAVYRLAATSCLAAKAAAGDLAVYFRYDFVTGHRPGNLTEWQLSDFLCGWIRP